MGWGCFERGQAITSNGTHAIDGLTQAVEHPTHEIEPHLDLERLSFGGDGATRLNSLHVAKGHQKNLVGSKPYYFSQNGCMALSRLDTTKIANRCKRSIGFDGRTRDTQHFAGSGNGIDSLQVIHRLQKATQVELWWLKGNTHDVGSC